MHGRRELIPVGANHGGKEVLQRRKLLQVHWEESKREAGNAEGSAEELGQVRRRRRVRREVQEKEKRTSTNEVSGRAGEGWACQRKDRKEGETEKGETRGSECGVS